MRGLKFSSILEELFGPPAPRFRTIQVYPKDCREPFAAHSALSSGDPPAETKAKRTEIMMHPHLPDPRPLAVPGIGFSQSIPMGPEILDPAAFRDLPPLRPVERIVWTPVATAMVWIPKVKST